MNESAHYTYDPRAVNHLRWYTVKVTTQTEYPRGGTMAEQIFTPTYEVGTKLAVTLPDNGGVIERVVLNVFQNDSGAEVIGLRDSIHTLVRGQSETVWQIHRNCRPVGEGQVAVV
ncbi:MAG: hypothetical protein A2898_05035 [Candidatus Kerfeldbacteria bacterium RIFCSPLOWO2_01_FULL_48_11]|uniref:Uncharacterized protein n=1 Tax=Candidatus Kerfeldbacteria bacterium RIFCSPLOWO2_01_FULL_48_11 TaxID=1798543 RepID=A0A1G2B2F0_9BACT|nr:MAG: hypothetical protein A2898_05035 [Candidatus Kerfeldbacteria bacterium RIFCSPLOWO2_01_FULL_48_11]